MNFVFFSGLFKINKYKTIKNSWYEVQIWLARKER